MKLEVNAKTLAAAVKAVAPAASTDECRRVLTGVAIHGHEGRLRLAATDSYRLHVVTLDHVEMNGHATVVPAGWLLRWANGHKRKPLDTVQLSLTNRRVMINEGDETTAVAPIRETRDDGTPLDYPTIDSILDTDTPDEGGAAVRPEYLAAALKAAATWRNADNDNTPVRIDALHPLKPCRFRMVTAFGCLQLVVMPVTRT